MQRIIKETEFHKIHKGAPPRRFIMFLKNGGDDVCARVGGANTYRFCASPFLKEFCMARLHFVLHLNPATSFFLKGSPPPPLCPLIFFLKPPPQKKRERGGGGEGGGGGRAVPRAWRGSALALNRG